MKYQIGDVIESGGVKRRVTGFTAVSGELFPNTELYNGSDPAPEEDDSVKGSDPIADKEEDKEPEKPKKK